MLYHYSHTNQRHRPVVILGKPARSANHAVRAWQFGWLEHGREVSRPTHHTPLSAIQFITWLSPGVSGTCNIIHTPRDQ